MANIELSALTTREWESQNLTYTDDNGNTKPVVWRYRMPNPSHRARILSLQMSILPDEDALAVARNEKSQAEVMHNMKLREAFKTKYAVQRFAFAACVIGVIGINVDGEPLNLDEYRSKQDVEGAQMMMLSDDVLEAMESGAVADEIAMLGQEIARLASLSGAQKKP